ncbi:hypothetical protein TVAG_296200 [Trichomonas vaginalis G3]|uniref:RRM domain-containing protein n=1 Tax=Trichomonas vaginalis (strain ATCC PRA-98 / G3) TaxID=412133 RepID=A2F769_TRIV3|nr:RNA recognition RRM/RNP domain family [Trichomonas vaginalis G3]EAX99236.1 hypothetical protein TVAG_296200 [Trichomonas vaginalis G3]KAI5547945.1 RNA recognition RRM/RNP domain family [Trichomonas vaginalis G3]|eukprot:XP_001312166.1 hypothetical protein [Trichomonas vaginalis G3]
MVLLEAHEKDLLKKWIIAKAKEIITDGIDPQILANYLMNLINRGVQYPEMVSTLVDIIGEDEATLLTDKLRECIESGSYKESEKPKEPAPQPKPAPKEEKKPSKPQPVEQKPKPQPKKSEESKPDYKKKEEPRYRSRDDDRPYQRPQKDDREKKGKYDKYEDRDKKGKYDKYDKRDKQDKQEKQKYEKPQKKDYRKRYSSDEETEYSDEEKDTQKRQLSLEDEPELKPKAKAERFIIFVAGLNEEYNSIGRIFKTFSKFGRIAGIEEDHEDGVCFIEYSKLAYAYRAIKKGAKITGNSFLRVDWGTHPNPEAIAALEKELEQKKLNWEKQNEIKTEKNSVLAELNTQRDLKIKQYAETPDSNNDEKDKIAQEILEIEKMIKECEQIE